MPQSTRSVKKRTGQTTGGHVAYVKVERIGKVTIYKRGDTYSLYYREEGKSVRAPVDGNLATARATASRVNGALAEARPTPLAYKKTSPRGMMVSYMDSVANVQRLALRTQDRYRAALTRFVDFCEQSGIQSIDAMDERQIEAFVKWLRKQTRARNGSPNGKQGPYRSGGIKFILSACRTAYLWAGRHRLLPPYMENPFSRFGIDRMRSSVDEPTGARVFTPKQEQAFFKACDPWQSAVFRVLATYGLRVGELTHLLIEDVDIQEGILHIHPKPEMFWTVKTRRERSLPLTTEMRELFAKLVEGRRAGFVFLNRGFAESRRKIAVKFESDKQLRARLVAIAAEARAADPNITERLQMRAVVKFCRSLGQLPERWVRKEFMGITEAIGCPEFTRVHDLRHLFSSRAQEMGLNPLLVQDLLGHASLDMTRRYTHLGMESMREAMQRVSEMTTGQQRHESARSSTAEGSPQS